MLGVADLSEFLGLRAKHLEGLAAAWRHAQSLRCCLEVGLHAGVVADL
jgi:hypothetical protein